MDYTILELIGTGATGQVYRARDERLGRAVALKVLRAQDGQTESRLLREAQTQSRIRHPRICQVYEAGHWRGKPAIAMQLVDGLPLDEALRMVAGETHGAPGRPVGLPLDRGGIEQRVRLFRRIADAVAAAHRAGLVHRDLKPGNVLIEVHGAEDHVRLEPFVVDFGLAMDPSDPALTATGHALGTPAYMAPEQAAGRRHELGPATDVYALGAMLYEQLAGIAPHSGDDPMAILISVTQSDPVPLSSRVPSLPTDLAVIVGKCLRREWDRRYPDAQALTDDLDRYLGGEPIAARPPTMRYRLRRALTRNRTATSLGAAGILLAALLLGALLAQRHAATQQLARAQDIVRTSERLAARIDAAYLEPVHDLSALHREVRAQVADLEEELGSMAPSSRAIAQTAIGLALLGLGDTNSARGYLQVAHDGGDEQARLPLGEALARSYLAELAVTRQLAPTQREIELAPAQRRFRDPAIELLQPSATTHLEDVPDIVRRSLLAIIQADRPGARRLLLDLPESTTGTERTAARLLLAELDAEDAAELWLGARSDAARLALDGARGHLAAAREIARSDPRLYVAECRLAAQQLEIDVSNAAAASLQQAPPGCETAVLIAPDRPEAYLARAAFLFHKFRIETLPREAGLAVLEIVHRDAERALELDPGSVPARVRLARVYIEQADYEIELRRHDGGRLQQALAVLDEALEFTPDAPAVLATAATIHVRTAYRLANEGQDPTVSYQHAIELQHRTMEAAPRSAAARASYGVFHVWLGADTLHRRDPTELFETARRELQRSIEMDPEYLRPLMHQASLELYQLDYLQGQAQDYLANADRGIELLERYLERRPGDANAVYNLMSLRLEQITGLLEAGRDTAEALRLAQNAQQQVEEVDPDTWHCHSVRLHWLLGIQATRAEEDPRPYWEEAQRVVELAYQEQVRPSVCAHWEAGMQRDRARWLRQNGHDSEPAIARGLAATVRSLELWPGRSQVSAIAGQLWMERAASAGDPLARRTALREAVRWFDAEIEANPTYEPWARADLQTARQLLRDSGHVPVEKSG